MSDNLKADLNQVYETRAGRGGGTWAHWHIEATLNAGSPGITESRRGRGGGTWAHWQVARLIGWPISGNADAAAIASAAPGRAFQAWQPSGAG